MSAGRARRIVTVCLGNYCRSPLAAAILAERGGAGLEVRSAGLIDKWVGQPACPVMIAAADEFDIDLRAHRGAQVTPELIDWADVVLAMDRDVLAALHELGGEHAAGKLRCYLLDADVPDPIGQPFEVFLGVVVQVREGAAQHLPAHAQGSGPR